MIKKSIQIKPTSRPKGNISEKNQPNFKLMARALLELYREEGKTTRGGENK